MPLNKNKGKLRTNNRLKFNSNKALNVKQQLNPLKKENPIFDDVMHHSQGIETSPSMGYIIKYDVLSKIYYL